MEQQNHRLNLYIIRFGHNIKKNIQIIDKECLQHINSKLRHMNKKASEKAQTSY